MSLSGGVQGREGFGSSGRNNATVRAYKRATLSAQVIGCEELLGAINALGGPLVRKFLRSGMRKAGSYLARLVKAQLRMVGAVETGTLLKSIGFKVYTRRGRVGAVIGARRDAAEKPPKYARSIVRGGTGRLRAATKRERIGIAAGRMKAVQTRVPANYAHLVEYGHRIVHGGKMPRNVGASFHAMITGRKTGTVSGQVAAKPFMRPAFEQGKAEAMRIVQAELSRGLEAEAGKQIANVPMDFEEISNA
jgi:hypothetical protein